MLERDKVSRMIPASLFFANLVGVRGLDSELALLTLATLGRAKARRDSLRESLNLASVPIPSQPTKKAAHQEGESGFFLMAGRGERI